MKKKISDVSIKELSKRAAIEVDQHTNTCEVQCYAIISLASYWNFRHAKRFIKNLR